MRVLDVQTSPLRSCFLSLPLHVSCRRPWNLDGSKRFVHPDLEVDCFVTFLLFEEHFSFVVFDDPLALTIFLCLYWKRTSHLTRPHGLRYSCKEMNAEISLAHAPPWLGVGSFGSLGFFLKTSHLFPSSCCWDFSPGVLGCNLPAWLQCPAKALDCSVVLYNHASKSHTLHQSSLSDKNSWTIQRLENDERWCLSASNSKEKN